MTRREEMSSVSNCTETNAESNQNEFEIQKRRSQNILCRASHLQIASVVSCFMTNFFTGGVANTFGLLYTYMQEPLGVSEYTISWLGSLMTGFQGFSGVVAAIFIDSIGCRMTTLLGCLLAVSGFIISSQTSNMYILYLTFGALPGLGVGFSYIATMVHVNRCFGRWRPVAVGISALGFGLGILFWPLLTSGIADIMGWRGTLLIQGALILHLVPCTILIKPSSNEERSVKPSNNHPASVIDSVINYVRIFKVRGIAGICVIQMLLGMSYYAFTSFMPLYVVTSNPELTKTDVVLIVSLAGVGSLVGRVLFSGLSMLHDKAPQYLFTLLLCLCGISHIIVPFFGDRWGLLTIGFLCGLTIGGWGVLNILVIVNMFGIDNLSKIYGTTEACSGAGSLCGPPLESSIATLLDCHELIFYSAGSFYIISCSSICLLLLLVNKKPAQENKMFVGNIEANTDIGTSNEGYITDTLPDHPRLTS